MMVNTMVKKPTRRTAKNKFSIRMKHPRAVSICAHMVRDQKLSTYIERLVLRDSLTIGNTKESIQAYKLKLIDEIRVEKQIIDTEIKRLKAVKESHITSLQEQLDKVNELEHNNQKSMEENNE